MTCFDIEFVPDDFATDKIKNNSADNRHEKVNGNRSSVKKDSNYEQNAKRKAHIGIIGIFSFFDLLVFDICSPLSIFYSLKTKLIMAYNLIKGGTAVNIHSKGKNKFIVELSKKDMLELDITYEEMDYSKIETRRVIWTILQKVRDNLGKDVDPTGNLLIEAAADSCGGCVLSFTIVEKRRYNDLRQPLKLTKTTDSVMYEFLSQNDLLDMLSDGRADFLKKQNRLFKKGDRFRLVLRNQPGYEQKKLLEEYAVSVGRDLVTLSHTLEHWQSAGSL